MEASASRAAGPQTTMDCAPLRSALVAILGVTGPGLAALDLNPLREDGRIESGRERLHNLRLRLERQVVIPPQHPHVAHHPALRRQVRGITPLPHLERCDVVRQDAVQERHRVSPRDAQPATRAALPDGGARTGRIVARVVGLVV